MVAAPPQYDYRLVTVAIPVTWPDNETLVEMLEVVIATGNGKRIILP
jgi:hypothetical protein